MSECDLVLLEKITKPVKTNGCLGGWETQLLFTDCVDIGIKAWCEKNLQKRAQNLGSPFSSACIVSGHGSGDGHRTCKKRS